MNILITLGVFILIIIGLGAWRINARRPKFFKGRLKNLESLLFRELADRLPADAGALVRKQAAQVKGGTRLYFPKSYCLETYGSPTEDSLFPRTDSFKLATLSFTHGVTNYKVEFKTYNGHVVETVIRPSCKPILGVIRVEVTRFKLNNDPMEKLDLTIVREFYEPGESFTGMLGKWQAKYSIKEVLKPLPGRQRELFVKLAEAKFPADYLELMTQTNGFEVGETVVHGLGAALESVSLEDDNYLTLAENGAGVLSLRQSRRSTELRFHSLEDESDFRDLGDNFGQAMETFLHLEPYQ